MNLYEEFKPKPGESESIKDDLRLTYDVIKKIILKEEDNLKRTFAYTGDKWEQE